MLASSIFEFTQQLTEPRIDAHRVKVTVLAHVPEVAITEFHGATKGTHRRIDLAQQRIATGEIVMRQSIVRPQIDNAAIDLEPFRVGALERQIIAVHAKGVDEIGIAIENCFEEVEFEIKLSLLLSFASPYAAGRFRCRFTLGLPLAGHVRLPCITTMNLCRRLISPQYNHPPRSIQ